MVVVKGVCLIVVVGAMEVVVSVAATVEVGLLLSGSMLVVEVVRIVAARSRDVLVG